MIVNRMKSIREKRSDDRLAYFRKNALGDLFNNLVLGISLALLGSIIGMYSSLEIGLSSDVQFILMVFFSLSVFFIIYLIIHTLSPEE